MMFCPHCGKQIADTARFCSGCGSPVAERAATPAPESGNEPDATAPAPLSETFGAAPAIDGQGPPTPPAADWTAAPTPPSADLSGAPQPAPSPYPPIPTTSSAYPPPPGYNAYAPPRAKKSRGTVILVSVVSVIVLAVAAVAICWGLGLFKAKNAGLESTSKVANAYFDAFEEGSAEDIAKLLPTAAVKYAKSLGYDEQELLEASDEFFDMYGCEITAKRIGDAETYELDETEDFELDIEIGSYIGLPVTITLNGPHDYDEHIFMLKMIEVGGKWYLLSVAEDPMGYQPSKGFDTTDELIDAYWEAFEANDPVGICELMHPAIIDRAISEGYDFDDINDYFDNYTYRYGSAVDDASDVSEPSAYNEEDIEYFNTDYNLDISEYVNISVVAYLIVYEDEEPYEYYIDFDMIEVGGKWYLVDIW